MTQPVYDYDDAHIEVHHQPSWGWANLAAQVIGSDIDQAVELWRGDALCAEIDPELFFPQIGDSSGSQAARRICRRCNIREACLQRALSAREEYGVWGGYTSTQRLRKKCS